MHTLHPDTPPPGPEALLLEPARSPSQQILDALPLSVFVVDEEVRILHGNELARQTFGQLATIYRKRGGEALHCLRWKDSPEGCGRGGACQDCVIRNAVQACFQGCRTFRARCRLQVQTPESLKDLYLLVTTTPLEFDGHARVLLMLEDISEMMELTALLPICCSCKNVRTDPHYWKTVETYLKEHLDMRVTHGICPDCVRKLYPELAAEQVASPTPPGQTRV